MSPQAKVDFFAAARPGPRSQLEVGCGKDEILLERHGIPIKCIEPKRANGLVRDGGCEGPYGDGRFTVVVLSDGGNEGLRAAQGGHISVMKTRQKRQAAQRTIAADSGPPYDVNGWGSTAADS